MKIVPRLPAARLQAQLRQFPAVMVCGPRQSGKTTLVRNLLPEWRHLDLERPFDLAAMDGDIEGFLAANPRHLVIDEAQRLPQLFPALRHAIDNGRGKGRYVLIGSASPTLMRSVSESLAGRVGFVELPPLSAAEIAAATAAGMRERRLAERWFWGGYPALHSLRGDRAKADWLDAYVSSFLERDLPALGIRIAPQRLRLLWSMLTHVHGNLLNLSDLARSLSVTHHTVADHLDVLEGAYMIRRLPPYFANVQKRLTKSPKLYVRDSGLLHFLAGLRTRKELEAWPRRGSSFEGLVIEEMAALVAELVVRPELFFWRTQAGAEVDLIVRDGTRLVPVEIKLASVVSRHDIAGLRSCMADLDIGRGYVVCGATRTTDLGGGVTIVPWADIVNRRFDFGLGGAASRRRH